MPSTQSTVQAPQRYLVLLRPDDPAEGARALAELAQVAVISRTADAQAERRAPCALVFDRIGAARVHCTEQTRQRLADAAAAGNSAILAIEPERTVYAIAASSRDPAPAHRRNGSRADPESTWGVRAVGADASPQTGKGIRIAVLDTGLDLSHPDFAGRAIVSRSFVEGQAVQDGNGHGTHCAGIAAGPASPGSQPRYGVAGEAELYVGKVLGDEGSGGDGGILEGIDWAIEHGCHIVSMSLGSPVEPGQRYSAVFEEVARRALAAGTLIVAAAGNESHRPDSVAPVGHPANCPSILAVAAVDPELRVAPFSCAGLEGDGGEVNIAAPGVDILSAWPAPELHRSISGTSMATPFVAGVAALHAQADPSARAARLGERLAQSAQPLRDSARDVGAGLARAPSGT
ncbi:S8 family serine peptidase [Castellaniella denitrificans]|uniref:S8 family serine peptidase n=1 Tax=Castellaniella denitrificans TaxID=56119 RepID=UPI003611519B